MSLIRRVGASLRERRGRGAGTGNDDSGLARNVDFAGLSREGLFVARGWIEGVSQPCIAISTGEICFEADVWTYKRHDVFVQRPELNGHTAFAAVALIPQDSLNVRVRLSCADFGLEFDADGLIHRDKTSGVLEELEGVPLPPGWLWDKLVLSQCVRSPHDKVLSRDTEHALVTDEQSTDSRKSAPVVVVDLGRYADHLPLYIENVVVGNDPTLFDTIYFLGDGPDGDDALARWTFLPRIRLLGALNSRVALSEWIASISPSNASGDFDVLWLDAGYLPMPGDLIGLPSAREVTYLTRSGSSGAHVEHSRGVGLLSTLSAVLGSPGLIIPGEMFSQLVEALPEQVDSRDLTTTLWLLPLAANAECQTVSRDFIHFSIAGSVGQALVDAEGLTRVIRVLETLRTAAPLSWLSRRASDSIEWG